MLKLMQAWFGFDWEEFPVIWIASALRRLCLGFDWAEWLVIWFTLAACSLVLALIGKSGQWFELSLVFVVGNPWVTSCQPTPIPIWNPYPHSWVWVQAGVGMEPMRKMSFVLKFLKVLFKKKMVFRAFRVDLDRHYFFQNLVCIALIAFETF